MHIIDLNGKTIEVTDLALAIMQADDYRHYRVAEPSPVQQRLYAYWEDVYQKLITCKCRDTQTALVKIEGDGVTYAREVLVLNGLRARRSASFSR